LLIVLLFKTIDVLRFWFENPSTFKPEQLSQLKQSSLARIVCDNSDDIQSVPKDLFRMEEEGSKHFVDCKSIPAMSLNMWFGKIFIFTVIVVMILVITFWLVNLATWSFLLS
jgi:peroxidase